MRCSKTTSLWLALALAATPALASKAAKEAKLQSKQAAKLYNAGQFREALALYEDAYRLDARPTTLFNIAQCHRMLGNYERALFFYRRYLDAFKGRPRNLKVVKQLVAECEQKQAELERLRAEEERRRQEEAEAQRLKELEMARFAAARAEAEARAAPTPDAGVETTSADAWASPLSPPPPPPPSEPLYKKWWLWAAIGAAAVAGGATYYATTPRPRPTSLGEGDLR